MGLKEMGIGIVLAGLFAFSLVTFGFNFAIDNNSTQNVLDDPRLSRFNETLQANLSKFQSNAETQRGVLSQAEGDAGVDDSFGLLSIIPITLSFFGGAITTLNIIYGGIVDVLGFPRLVVNLMLGIVILMMILLSWRIWKAGS